MDSHAWEADLRAIRAGTAPRHELFVRYGSAVAVTDALVHSHFDPTPVEPDGWLEVFEDDAALRPLVRVPVDGHLDIGTDLHRRALLGWPQPGRALALADGAALPLGPAYPLRPGRRLPRGAVVALAGAPLALAVTWTAVFGLRVALRDALRRRSR